MNTDRRLPPQLPPQLPPELQQALPPEWLPHWQPRKPWVAGLMSLALPGWGQLYNGQANRAIWCFLTFSLLLLPGTALLSLVVPPLLMLSGLLLGLVAALGLWIFCALDAYRVAQRASAYVIAPWQTSGLYVLVFISCALLVLPGLTVALRAHLVQPFVIPSASMAPSLLPGDFVFADMHYNCHACSPVQRGDVAIFTYPNDRTLYYVKRIVALPGDRVQILNHQVIVNGQGLAAPAGESGEAGVTGETGALEHWGAKTWQVQGLPALLNTASEQTVPPGHVFLLGDNRAASTDSRQFGAVPLADVVGRVRQVWFSRGDGVIRWQRIGKRVN